MSDYSAFRAASAHGIGNAHLQGVMKMMRVGMPMVRKMAVAKCLDYEAHQAHAIAIKNHVLDHLGHYLAEFETNAIAAGAQVHWAVTGAEMNIHVARILKDAGAKRVIKGKSMVSEETGLNAHLEAQGYHVRETDLGEYIIQLADERPSHIVGPAIHKSVDEVRTLFRAHHDLGARDLPQAADLVSESRNMVRPDFAAADAGIIGTNALIAETGSAMLVTNEGNGDLCSSLPDTQIIVTSIEKLVPRLEDATAILRLLVRNATGQASTCYTSFFTGARRDGDRDGPSNVHIVLLDNGRSAIARGKYKDMLRCIKCAACMNHCPIYTTAGGHSYGHVYMGPMGSVLTPLFEGLKENTALPNACTTCGRCEEVCPMKIPLPHLLRELRAEEDGRGLNGPLMRACLHLYGFVSRHPWLFRLMAWFGARMPLPSVSGRISPRGRGRSFMEQWEKRT